MKKIVCLLSLILLQSCASAQTEPRLELEKAYSDVFAAVSARDGQKLKESLPAFSYAELKNEFLARKQDFPAEFFDVALRVYPDPTKLTYIRTVRLSPQVVYTQHWLKEADNPSDSSSPIQTVIMSVAFVNEAGKWKFAGRGSKDAVPEQESRSIEKFAATLKPDFGAELGSGRIPAVPAEYGATDYLGSLVIRAENCKVTVNLNGTRDSVEHQSLVTPLVSRLKPGTNSIQISVERRNGEGRASPKVEVEVWVKGDPVGANEQTRTLNGQTRVFIFTTDKVGDSKKEFALTDDVIKRN